MYKKHCNILGNNMYPNMYINIIFKYKIYQTNKYYYNICLCIYYNHMRLICLYSDMRICESSIKKKYIKKSTEMVAIFRLDFMNIDFTF